MRVHVHDELVFEPVGALLRHRRSGRFGLRHAEQRPVDLVHGEERGRHPGRGLEEPPAVEALLAAEVVGHRQQTLLDLALLGVLRIGIILVARHDLGRNGGGIRAQLRRHELGDFFLTQQSSHFFLLRSDRPDWPGTQARVATGRARSCAAVL
jgi:hypothetical protein